MTNITKQTSSLATNIELEHKILMSKVDDKMRYKIYDMFKSIFEDDKSLEKFSWEHSTDMDKFVNIKCADGNIEELLYNIPHRLLTSLFAHWCTVTVHRYGDIVVEDHNRKETKIHEMLGHFSV